MYKRLFGSHAARLLIGIGAALLLAACAAPADEHSTEMTIPPLEPVTLGAGERLAVVATTGLIGDVVGQVGGDQIDLTVLIEPGRDPHTYEAVPEDLAAIERAAVIFVNGLGLEETLLGSIQSTATGVIVPISAGIEPREWEEDDDHDDDHDHAADPHFWMDPANVMVWARNAAQVLGALDPAHAAEYDANAAAYIAELETLDAYIREQVARIPAERRKLVTDHESFGYFAGAYGFELVGAVVPGVTTSAAPSAGDIARLVEVIRAEGVPAIFVGEASGAGLERLAEQVAAESGMTVRVLPLYTGALDAPGTPADTYIGMMRANIDRIVEGLGGG
ncbi:MAG: zinc ABC transporter substrate-binding protein AztC [Anaerolineae bacterium]